MGVFRSSLRTSERYKVRLVESDHFAVLQTCYLPEHSGKSILPFAQARFQNRPQKRQCRRDAAFSGTGAVYTKPRFERKKSEKIEIGAATSRLASKGNRSPQGYSQLLGRDGQRTRNGCALMVIPGLRVAPIVLIHRGECNLWRINTVSRWRGSDTLPSIRAITLHCRPVCSPCRSIRT